MSSCFFTVHLKPWAVQHRWAAHLVQQVQSRHVGLLSLQQLAGDLEQLLLVGLLQTQESPSTLQTLPWFH